MANKPVDPNAKAALNQMKLEIANELGMENVCGQMSKKLVAMGEEALLRQYNSKK